MKIIKWCKIFLIYLAASTTFVGTVFASNRYNTILGEIEKWIGDSEIIEDVPSTNLSSTGVIFTSQINDTNYDSLLTSRLYSYENFIIVCDSDLNINIIEISSQCSINGFKSVTNRTIEIGDTDEVIVSRKINQTNIYIIPEVFFVSSTLREKLAEYFSSNQVNISDLNNEKIAQNVISLRTLIDSTVRIILASIVISSVIVLSFRNRINLKLPRLSVDLQLLETINLYLIFVILLSTLFFGLFILLTPYDRSDLLKLYNEFSFDSIYPPRNRYSLAAMIGISIIFSIFFSALSIFIGILAIKVTRDRNYIYQRIARNNDSRKIVIALLVMLCVSFLFLTYPYLTYISLFISSFIVILLISNRKLMIFGLYKYEKIIIFLVIFLVTFLSTYVKDIDSSEKNIINFDNQVITLPSTFDLEDNSRFSTVNISQNSNVYANDILIFSPHYQKINNEPITNFREHENFHIISPGPSKVIEYLVKNDQKALEKVLSNDFSNMNSGSIYKINSTNVNRNFDYFNFEYKCKASSINQVINFRVYSSLYDTEEGKYLNSISIRFLGCDGDESRTYKVPIDLYQSNNERLYFLVDSHDRLLKANIDAKIGLISSEGVLDDTIPFFIPPIFNVIASSESAVKSGVVYSYNFSNIDEDFYNRDPFDLGNLLNVLINKELIQEKVTLWSNTSSYIKLVK